MKLTIEEAAALLASDEEKVEAWIEESGLPAHRVRGQYRINRTELLEWATERRIPLAPAAFAPAEGEPPTATLAGALRLGGVHHDVPGKDLAEVLRSIAAFLPLGDEADRETLLEILLGRETLGLVAIGDGIAIPHVRTPIVGSAGESAICLAFVVAPLALPAPDDRPVDTIFFLVSPTIPAHLALLAKLAYGLSNAAFRDAVRRHAAADELLRLATEMERA